MSGGIDAWAGYFAVEVLVLGGDFVPCVEEACKSGREDFIVGVEHETKLAASVGYGGVSGGVRSSVLFFYVNDGEWCSFEVLEDCGVGVVG